MAITTFIPKVWSARLLEHLRNVTVYSQLFNRNYEGEIAEQGDTVHIAQLTDIAVKKYTRNTEIAAPDDLATTDLTLVVDQADYFNFHINDVDRVQARADLMDQAMQSAAYGLADSMDKYLAGVLGGGAITAGLGTASAPLVITADNAYDTLIKIKTAMDKANVPTAGRMIVMPPEYEGFMLLDKRFASGEGVAADGRLVNGRVGRAAGFDILISNNVPNTSGAKYKVIAGTNIAATMAEQISKVEAYRMEKGFDDAMKGLHVYGAKLLQPATVAVAVCNFTA